MAEYAISNKMGGTQQALASSFKTLLYIFATSGSLKRGKLGEFNIGTNSAPADNFVEYDISRMTADGTATSITPNPVDSADGAAVTTAKANATAEPTVTSNSDLWYDALNQRASYRWVARPGKELIWPATANNGLVIRAKSASYSGTVAASASFSE
jgi:hypothetical protein